MISSQLVTGRPGPIWRPGPAELGRSRFEHFRRGIGEPDAAGLDRLARKDPATFWSAVTDWLGFDWQQAPPAVLDQLAEPHTTRWFPGGRFNLADNAVRRWVRAGRGHAVALTAEDENGGRTALSFAELSDAVDRAARGLRDVGVEPGDRVGMQLAMTVESVLLQLACALVGAVVVPVFSGFGPSARLMSTLDHRLREAADRSPGRTGAGSRAGAPRRECES